MNIPMNAERIEGVLNNANETASQSLSQRMYNPKLMALRTQNPFISIMPFPNESVGLALSAGVAQDINLPEGTKMVMFSGNGEYYVSRKGIAQVPTLNDPFTGSIMNPEFSFMYVEEIRQLSAVAPYDMKLTVHCYTQM